MKSRTLGFILGLTLALSTSLFAPNTTLASCLEHAQPKDTVFDSRIACNEREWVALVDGSTCPTIDRFHGKVLDELGSLVQGRTFCKLVWNPATKAEDAPFATDPTRDEIAALREARRKPEFHGLVPRCGVVAALQSSSSSDPTDLGEMTKALLAREFLLQVGKVELPLAEGTSPSTRLVFLDSQKDGEGPPQGGTQNGAFGHGYALAHMAREIVCNDESKDSLCAAEIATRLALPLRRNDDPFGPRFIPDPEGGAFGTPLDLAVALEKEIRDWRDKSSKPHLILNLSLGWDHEMLTQGLGAVSTDGLNAEELAVLAVLEAAVQDPNILVLAAAGNGGGPKVGGITNEGPLWPAAWSIRTPSTQKLITPSGKKLVWAVGAVDRRKAVLATSRPRSTPPIAAYGDHAVARDLDGTFTEVLTGTSVSTAVASAIAAIVWEFQPSSSAREVMNLVFDSAEPLTRKADHYRSGLHQRPAIHRLTAAAALGRAWAPIELRAKTLDFLPAVELTCDNAPLVAAKGCGEKVFVCRPSTSSSTPDLAAGEGCPIRLYPTIQQAPWMLPQPGENQCPSCAVGSGPPPASLRAQAAKATLASKGWHLLLSRPQLGDAPCLTELRLDITSLSGKVQPAMVFPGQSLCRDSQGSASIRVEQLPLPDGLSIGTATLSFRYGTQRLSGKISLYHNEKPNDSNIP